jgi:hypothetical protein
MCATFYSEKYIHTTGKEIAEQLTLILITPVAHLK